MLPHTAMAQHTPSVFAMLLLFAAVGLAFLAISLGLGSLLRKQNPYAAKLKPYESGEEPLMPAWHRPDLRFYVVAIVFVLFEAELVFLFPWATVFGNEAWRSSAAFGWTSFWRMVIFLAILVIGLWYAWAKGHLTWLKPTPRPVDESAALPADVYADFQRAVNAPVTTPPPAPNGENPAETA